MQFSMHLVLPMSFSLVHLGADLISRNAMRLGTDSNADTNADE